MKTMIFYESVERRVPVAILTYDDEKLTGSDICDHVFTMLQTLSESSGYRITCGLDEISEEIPSNEAA